MKKSETFFIWFINLGGEIKLQSTDAILNKMYDIPLTFSSSIKHRATEFKEKYNYKFNQ